MTKVAKIASVVVAVLILAFSVMEVALRVGDALNRRNWNFSWSARNGGLQLSYRRAPEARVAVAIDESYRDIALRYQAELALRLDSSDPISMKALLDVDSADANRAQFLGDGLSWRTARTRAPILIRCRLPRPQSKGIHLRYNC